MAKKTEVKNVPVLPLNTPLTLKAYSKLTGECFEKQITYEQWLNLVKHKDYNYYTHQLI